MYTHSQGMSSSVSSAHYHWAGLIVRFESCAITSVQGSKQEWFITTQNSHQKDLVCSHFFPPKRMKNDFILHAFKLYTKWNYGSFTNVITTAFFPCPDNTFVFPFFSGTEFVVSTRICWIIKCHFMWNVSLSFWVFVSGCCWWWCCNGNHWVQIIRLLSRLVRCFDWIQECVCLLLSSSSECSFETHSQGDGEGRKNKWKSCLEHSKFNNNLLCSEPMFCTNFILFSLMLLYLLLSFGDKPFGFVFKRNTQFVCLVLLRAPLQFHYRSVLGTFFPVHFGELNFVQIVSVFHQKTRCNAVQLEPDWSKENDEGVPRPAHDLWFNFSCTKILPKNIKPTSPHSWASSILSVYYSYEQTTPRERERVCKFASAQNGYALHNPRVNIGIEILFRFISSPNRMGKGMWI